MAASSRSDALRSLIERGKRSHSAMQDEVLRVRQAMRLEQGAVHPDDGAGRHREGEADLPVEGERVVGQRGHSSNDVLGLHALALPRHEL